MNPPIIKEDVTVHPFTVIQGGMGVGISGWLLARTISLLGQLGVVTGVGLWVIMARMLQDGDPGGHYQRALAEFNGKISDKTIVPSILKRYYLPDGRKGKPYRNVPMMRPNLKDGSQQGPLAKDLEDLMAAAGFAEVWLAKQGHTGLVGINLLEKVQLGLLPVLYGAMLANVDYVLMGAGLPFQIPGILDLLVGHQPVRHGIEVKGASSQDDFAVTFDPRRFGSSIPLHRPYFFPIISIDLVAKLIDSKKNGAIDGWVVENPSAGGHNPPNRSHKRTPDGQPDYGDKDEADLDKIRFYGLPYWLGGSYASPEKLQAALKSGAAGVQAGSIFAVAYESGMDPTLKREVIAQWRDGTLRIRTDPDFSPSGFPFKLANVQDTLAGGAMRCLLNCDIGILRTPYKLASGRLGYRCPAEPKADYLKKGGKEEDTRGRGCICNGLFSTMGCGQVCEDGSIEPSAVTLGSDLSFLHTLIKADVEGYTAEEALSYLLAPVSM